MGCSKTVTQVGLFQWSSDIQINLKLLAGGRSSTIKKATPQRNCSFEFSPQVSWQDSPKIPFLGMFAQYKWKTDSEAKKLRKTYYIFPFNKI